MWTLCQLRASWCGTSTQMQECVLGERVPQRLPHENPPCARRARVVQAHVTPYIASRSAVALLVMRATVLLTPCRNMFFLLAHVRREFERLPQMLVRKWRRGRRRWRTDVEMRTVWASRPLPLGRGRADRRMATQREVSHRRTCNESAGAAGVAVSARGSERSRRTTGPHRRKYASKRSAGTSTGRTATCAAASCGRAWIVRPAALRVYAALASTRAGRRGHVEGLANDVALQQEVLGCVDRTRAQDAEHGEDLALVEWYGYRPRASERAATSQRRVVCRCKEREPGSCCSHPSLE